MNSEKVLMVLCFLFFLHSGCCKKKHCSNIENVFSPSEKDWVYTDTTGLPKDSAARVYFVNTQNEVDSFFVNSTYYKSEIRCETPCCKVCKEDEKAFGTLAYVPIVETGQEGLSRFTADISKAKTGFDLGFKVNSIYFSDFDSTYTSLTIQGKTYASVFVKILDTTGGNQPVYKVWFSKKNGLLKYQLTQQRSWELQ